MAPSNMAIGLAAGAAVSSTSFVLPALRQTVSQPVHTTAQQQSSASSGLLVSCGAVLGVAAAATSRRIRVESSVAVRAFENELGVQAPMGFWDPAGFTQDGLESEFRRRRCVELKHGRVSMLACIGYIVPEYFKFPGYICATAGIKFQEIPNGPPLETSVCFLTGDRVAF